jgi:hypothetical protein
VQREYKAFLELWVRLVPLEQLEPQVQALREPQALLASRALLELLALLAQLELALQALQAFKDRLALLVLARLATMTWGLSISKTTPPPRPLRTLMIELLLQAPCSRVSYITSPKTAPLIRSSIQAPAGCFTLLPHSTLKLTAKIYAAFMLAIALTIALP